MGRRPSAAANAASLVLALAVSLLGVRLFLPVTAAACAPTGGGCCCAEVPPPDGAPTDDGCGCSVSRAVPLPAAVLATPETVSSPGLVAVVPDAVGVSVPRLGSAARIPAPVARNGPIQALLETFRN